MYPAALYCLGVTMSPSLFLHSLYAASVAISCHSFVSILLFPTRPNLIRALQLIRCRRKDKEMMSYKAVSKEVDVGVPPVIKGCVNRTDHPWESLRDQPRIAVTLWVLLENLVILAVIPPEPSACIEKQQSPYIHFTYNQREVVKCIVQTTMQCNILEACL